MIMFSLLYARGPLWAAVPVAFHITFQLAFTSAVHAREIVLMQRRGLLAGAITMFIIAIALGWLVATDFHAGEMVYRFFMSFYGLIFPAYAWICMLPTWRNPQIHRGGR